MRIKMVLCLCLLMSLFGCGNLNETNYTNDSSIKDDNSYSTAKASISSLYESETANYIIKEIEKLPDFQIGMLYDFDLDAIPEVVIFADSMIDFHCEIYKLGNEGFVFYGEIIVDDNYPIEDTAYLELYKDESKNEYFYCSNPIDFIKNNTDESGYGVYCGTLYKYIFDNFSIESSIALSYQEDYSDDLKLQNYIQDCEDYLKQYKKIKRIPVVPLWDYEDIKNGTFKDIILLELNHAHGYE